MTNLSHHKREPTAIAVKSITTSDRPVTVNVLLAKEKRKKPTQNALQSNVSDICTVAKVAKKNALHPKVNKGRWRSFARKFGTNRHLNNRIVQIVM